MTSVFYSQYIPDRTLAGVEGRSVVDLTSTSFADLMANAADYSSATQYQKGAIVYNQNSTWVYVNNTAGSNNAPPTLPTISNAHWELLGTNGTFTWIAYANSTNGTTFTDFTTGAYDASGIIRKWIGIAPNKTSAVESTSSADYSWTKIVGEDGVPGNTSATINIYIRSASAPTLPSAATTYTFNTAALTGLTNGWTTSIPSGTNPLYVASATAFSNTGTDTIAANEWSSPVILASNGTSGLSVATVFLYQRTATASAPAVVTTGSATYTFSTGGITGQPTSWVSSIPSSGGAYLWVIQATASNTATTDSIANTEWSTPSLLSQDGAAGAPGLNTATVYLYQRSSTVPTGPTGTFTYTFSSGLLSGGTLGSWTQTIPAGTSPLYVIIATASSTTSTDSIPNTEFSAPVVLAENGTPGSPGTNTAIVYLYQRSATAPTAPTGTFTYTFSTGILSGGTPGSWTQTIPAGSNPLYVIAATAASTTSSDTIASTEFSAPVILAQDGAAGLNNATVYLYQRSATAPAQPAGTFTYTFSSGVLSGGTPGSWTQTIPTGTNPLYVITATASSNTSTDSIPFSEFSTARILAENGAAGAPGLNSATVFLYQRSATAPAQPTGTFTYTFSTGALSGGTPGSWTQNIPTGTNPLYVITATAISSTATDDIPAAEFSTARILTQDGTPGAAGLNNAIVYLYQRSATAPTAPTGTFTYTFSSRVLSGGVPGSWTQTIPAGSNPLYVIAATASSNTATDDIPATEFSSPVILVQDGAQGAPGTNNATVSIYLRSATAPANVTGTFTYTFATNAISPALPGSWSQTVTTGANPLYIATALASSNSATASITFSAPVLFVQNGAAGANATRTAILEMYQWASSAPSVFPVGTSTYTWSTGAFTAPGTPNSWTLVPGTPSAGQTLYVVRQIFTDTDTSTTSSVTWSANSSLPSGAAGTNGTNGTNGQRVGVLELYRWSATSPTTYPSGDSTYTWADGSFTAPGTLNGWSLTPPGAVVGQTLWGISVRVSNNLTTATSNVTWNSTTPYAIGYAGTNGTNGVNGERGSKQFFATGSSWSDTTADTAITTQGLTKVLLDQVTISNGTSFAQTRFWNGSAWTTVTQVIDGNLLVNGTVGANSLVAGTILANTFNVGSTNFQLNGAAQGAGKGALIVSNGQQNMLTAGYIDGTNIGISIRDAAGNIVMQSSAASGSSTASNTFSPAISNNTLSLDSVTNDALLLDPSMWLEGSMPASRFFKDTDGTGYLVIPSGVANDLIPKFATATPIDHSATYEAQWEIMEEGSGTPTSRYYTVVYCWDAAGTIIPGPDGTYWYYPSNFTTNIGRGSYERRLARFGKGTLRPFPSNAVKFGIGLLLNYNASPVVTRARRVRTTRIDAENFSVNGDASRWQLSNDSAIRWSGVAGWTQTVVRSKTALTGAQSLSFDLVSPSAMCGLTDAANAAGYADLDYAFYAETGATGVIQIYESGSNVWNTSGYTNVEDVRFRIEYDGNRIKYYLNGGLARTVTVGGGKSFRAAVDCNTIGAGFRNIRHVSAETNAYIGENTFDKVGNPVAIEHVRNNLALIDWWKKGATIPWNTNGESNSIISVPADASTVQPPIAGQPDVWFCQEVTNDGNAGGGWHNIALSPLNPDKTYRFVVPIRGLTSSTFAGQTTPKAYWGTNNVANLNTTTLNTNPYFAVVERSAMQNDRWYLFVGYIFPRNSTGKSNDSAGVWDCKTGQKISTGTNYTFLPDGSQPTHRAYQFYAGNGSQQVFGMPLIEPIERMSDLTLYFEDGARLNNAITIDANGNFINPVGTGSGTSVSNTLVAKRLVSRGSVATIIEGNTIRRSSGDNDYASFVTGDPVTGACFAEAIIAGGGYTMIAFDTAASSGNYADQDFVIHASATAGTAVYRNGTYLGSVGSVTAGHLLRIVYDGERFQIFVNGSQVGPDYAAPSGQTLFPIFNAYNGPGSYTGLNYGPYSINSAQTKFIVNTASGSTLRLIGSNTILRDAGGTDWNSQCYSSQGYEGGAFCSFSPSTATCYFMAGLNTDPTADASYSSIDYAFYMPNSSEIRIYESGNGITAPDGTVVFGTWAAGTVLSVIYDNEYVRYLINGDEVRCVRTEPRRKFFFDSSVVNGDAITNIQFGPVTPEASNVDFIHSSNIQSQRGNSVYKNSKGINGPWNAKSVSRQMQRGNAVVSARLIDQGTFIGLHAYGNTGTNFDSLAYSFHRSTDGKWYIYESGSYITDFTAPGGIALTSDTEFRIEYDGVRIRYWANTTLVREVTAGILPDVTYQAGVAISTINSRVTNIQFGAYTDNAWGSVGGTGKPSDNATSDIRLVGKGTGIVIKGNNVSRPTGGGTWSAGSYTADSYTGGAFCSFTYPFATEIMAGLNSDPLTGNSYTTIDYCWYCPANFGSLFIYESGADYAGFGPFTATTVLSVTYDNEYVRYLKDGVEVRSVYVGAGKKFHFDSSVVAGEISNIRFGPYAAANAPLSFINTTGHSSEGNMVFKRSNATNDWDGKSISREISEGTAFVSAKLDTVDTFIGLHEVGNTNATFPAFAYSIHRSGNGTWAIYEDGGSPLNLGSSYNNNSQWSIRYDGVNVRYYEGTTLLRTVASAGSRSFQAGVSCYSQGSRVSGIQFGPFTDRRWANIAGTGRPQDNANNTSIDGNGTIQGVSAGSGTTVANNQITISPSTGQISGIGSTGNGESVANNRNYIIRDPGGALSVDNPASVSGAIKIRLPQSWTSTMMRFTVDIYEYAAGFMCSMEIGGYNYGGDQSVGPHWVNVTARVLGGSNVEYPVYYGHDGTRCCVWIGSHTDTWSYPQIRVKDFLGGHSNSGKDLWASGWSISFDTTVLGAIASGSAYSANKYNASVTDTLPGADWSKTARRPGNLSVLTGSEGIQNTLITVNGSGQLTGIGSGENTVVQNTLIQVDANGNFVNAGATGNGTSISNTLVARRLVSAGSVAATIQGNTIIRASGNEDYNSFVYGEAILGSCFAEAIIAPNSWTMIAFDTVATTGNYTSQDFVVHANPASSINIYQNGTGLVTLSAPTAGHLLRVTYDGVKYQVFVNGTQVGANYAAPANQRYFPIFNAYNQNIRYSGLNYGPYTDNAWASVGGTGRPADNATVGAIAGTNLLRSNTTVLNDNDIITSAGTAAAIANQTAWATYSTHAPADVAPKTVDWLGPRTYQDVSVAANGSARWLRVARVDAPGGRGTATVSISGAGGGVTPGKLTLEVSVDWSGLATLTILSASRYFPAQSIRLSRTGTQTYLDLLATPIGTGTGLRIEVIPNVGSGGIWQVNYVDNPSIGSTNLGSISIEGASGGTRLTGTVILDGGTVTSTLSDAGGGIRTNGTQAIDSSGNAFDVLAGSTKAVAERGANITETRTASGILNQAATATSSDFSAVTGSTKPEGNATNDRYFDRRNTNQAPNWYLSNYNVRTAYEFKDASVLGVPGSSPGFWGALVTTNDYADFSGGEIKQRFTYGSGVTAGTSYVRTGSGTTWTAWLKDFNGYLRPTFDSNDLLETGSTVATVANFKTSSGTSAGILNQGALATRSTARIGTDIVDDDGTTVLTAPKVRNNRTDGSMAMVAAPEGGSLTLDAPNTGAIRIGLPAARRGSNTMMAFRVTIYDYDPNTSVIYEVGGYNYETGWINTFVRALGPTNAAKPVRFGRDGTRDYIWIGNLNTVWQYPKVSITDLRTGYSNFAHGLWETGWQVVLTTSDFVGVVATYLEPNAGDTVFGINAKEEWNGAIATLPNFKTSQGTASGILNQATTATSSDFASVTGTTKPANNATVGAVIGTNLTGTFTETEVGNRFNSNSISSTYIKDISASKITTGTLAATASITVGSSGGNAAVVVDGSKRQIIVRDAANNIRVKIGDLSV